MLKRSDATKQTFFSAPAQQSVEYRNPRRQVIIHKKPERLVALFKTRGVFVWPSFGRRRRRSCRRVYSKRKHLNRAAHIFIPLYAYYTRTTTITLAECMVCLNIFSLAVVLCVVALFVIIFVEKKFSRYHECIKRTKRIYLFSVFRYLFEWILCGVCCGVHDGLCWFDREIAIWN